MQAIERRRYERKKALRDGKIAATVIIIAILATLILGCSPQKGCQATSHMAGY